MIASKNNIPSSTTATAGPTIVFECSNIKEDMGLLLLENKEGKLELHLHNDYTSDAMMMTVDIKDLARMCQALEECFQREQIET